MKCLNVHMTHTYYVTVNLWPITCFVAIHTVPFCFWWLPHQDILNICTCICLSHVQPKHNQTGMSANSVATLVITLTYACYMWKLTMTELQAWRPVVKCRSDIYMYLHVYTYLHVQKCVVHICEFWNLCTLWLFIKKECRDILYGMYMYLLTWWGGNMFASD